VTSYAEQVQHNPALKAFVEAEVARACVRLASLIVDNDHQRMVIDDQKRRIAELEAGLRDKSRR
jgi:hypothetical protein